MKSQFSTGSTAAGLTLTTAITLTLIPSPAEATSMPGVVDVLILGLIFFGSVLSLLFGLVFTLFLLLRLHTIAARARAAAASGASTPSTTPAPVGKWLPISAIVVSVFLLLVSLAGLRFSGSFSGATNPKSIWVSAGWAALFLLSLTNIFWASIVLRSPSWSPRGLLLARVLPLVATVLIPALLPMTSLLKGSEIAQDNRQARRFVERTLPGHFRGENDLAFAFDGRYLVSVSDQDFHPLPVFWNLSTGEKMIPSHSKTHGGGGLPPTQVDVTTGKHIRGDLSAASKGDAWSLAISPATGLVAVGMSSGRIALRKGPGGAARALLFPPPKSPSGNVVALAFDATGQHLLGAERKGLLILHTLTRRADKKPTAPATVYLKKRIVALGSLAASRFISLTKDGELQRWRVNGDALAKDGQAASGCKKACALATRPGAQHLAVGCQDGTIRLLAQDSLAPEGRVLAHPRGVTALALAPKNAQLLSGGDDGRVRLWSLPKLQGGKVILSPMKKRRTRKVRVLKAITRIVFSRAGDRFAVGTASKHHNIHVFRVAALEK